MNLNESFDGKQVLAGFLNLIRGNVAITDAFKPSGRVITDLNKAASNSNSLIIYGLVSSNVDPDAYKKLAQGLETKIATLIQIIAKSYVGGKGDDVIDFIRKNLSNADHILDMLPDDVKASIMQEGSIVGKLAEEIQSLSSSDIIFTQPMLTEAAKTVQGSSVGNSRAGMTGGNDKKYNTGMQQDTVLNSKNGSVFMSPGNVFNFDIKAFDKNDSPVVFSYSIMVKVNLIEVDSSVLLESIAESNNRDTWFQYLRYRAGKGSVLRDVIANLNTIERDIKLATSDKLSDRIVRSLSSKGGFYSPKALDFGKIDEFKKFIIIMDSSDVDVLSGQHNFVLTRPAALKVAFKNLNMLSLIIVDKHKKRLTMIDSDSPTEMKVISMSDLDKTKKLADMLSKMA